MALPNTTKHIEVGMHVNNVVELKFNLLGNVATTDRA
jgi:hypothetical protein